MEAYREIAQANEIVKFDYSSPLAGNSMAQVLHTNLTIDKATGRTIQGIHRDDLLVQLNGHSFKKYGSQGQVKTCMLALKLAQWRFLYQKTNRTPILLLDDVFDKIDQHRAYHLLQTICSNNSGQIMITDTERTRIAEILARLGEDVTYYEVANGHIQATD